MSAATALLAGHGPEDRWLTEQPNRTYFEAKYNPRTNRSRETYEIPFDNQVTFDSTGRCTIPVKGDYMTRLTLRTVLPPIYPTVPGQYVFPTPSSEVGATVYVNKSLSLVVADGVTLTANTVGNHYFSIGAQVTLKGTAYVNLDGTYTITGIPTANSFTCSTGLTGTSSTGFVSTPGIECGDIISYFSTTNSNLWVNNITNKTWQITGGTNIGTSWTFTTSAPSNFPIGSQVELNLPSSAILNQIFTVTTSTDTTFTCTINNIFVISGFGLYSPGGVAYSVDYGQTWITGITSLSTYWLCSGYGNKTFIVIGLGSYDFQFREAYSTDYGKTWNQVIIPNLSGADWYGIPYGNGTFVMVTDNNQVYSTDNGQTWTEVVSPLSGIWRSVAYGNGRFVMVGIDNQAYSTDNGQTWSQVGSPLTGYWYGVAYGNGTFVMAGLDNQAYSTDNGQTWTQVVSPISGSWENVAYGNGTFVMVGVNNQAYSTNNGQTWSQVGSPLTGLWNSVAYGNGKFIMVGGAYLGDSLQAYSTDNGHTWINVTETFNVESLSSVVYGEIIYTNSPSDSVSFVNPPFQLTNRVFSSSTYPSISFANAADAAFWGFDSREGLTYALPATPPWTYTQSGWISGFLPPSTSTYDDSVAHKLCKAVRVLVGKQTIKEYSGEYIELQNDLLVPYENKAILKLMNGTLDQTQATVAREYYVNLSLGTKEVPLCALTHQNMSVEVDFDSYLNLSQNLNQGTGDFLDAKSYTTYNASTGLLNGQPVNVQTTFSYQQYIFIVTYGGQFIIFDTTKNVDDPTSYIVLSAFSGSNLFKQFCVLSGNLYIGLTDGTLARMIISEVIQGNIFSFLLNNYTPTIGSLTGTMVADFRYVYYTVSNTASSNVFLSRYDTTGSFTNPSSYTTVDFTNTFNSNVTGVYQTLSTGTELVLLPQGAPGKLYTYQLNANVQSQWYVSDYSQYGNQITEGVLIGSTLYFVFDNFSIFKYNSNSYQIYQFSGGGYVITGIDQQSYSSNGISLKLVDFALPGFWLKTVYGDGTFVMVGLDNQAYSTDYGKTWTQVGSPLTGYWYGVAYGNDTFVMVGLNNQAYSTDKGLTWTQVNSPINFTGNFIRVAYGNGSFVMVGYNPGQAYSTDNGRSWSLANLLLFGDDWTDVVYGNGSFVMVSRQNHQAYSDDNGLNWYYASISIPGDWIGVAYGNKIFNNVGLAGVRGYSNDNGRTWISISSGFVDWTNIAVIPAKFTIPGDGFRNLIAVGNYIYCSTNNVAVQIDTTKDLSTAAAYSFPAPLPINQYVFANGPRYVYMFAQGDNTATNIVEFDPYGPDQTFKASILVDYESLPEGTKKPDKAILGLIQTQKVTDMTNMNIKGPVKELWVTGASATTNVFQYSNLATQSTLDLANEPIVTEDVGTRTFMSTIQPFETHTSMPIRNVSVVPFEFDPESAVPNGTVNFSRIRDQIFDGGAETVWARSYNLFAIQGGIGNLMYN